MGNAKKRSLTEKFLALLFVLIITLFYLVYKYPTLFVREEQIRDTFYFLGKSLSFWYGLIYTLLVCGISLRLLVQNKSPYLKGNKVKELGTYHRWKFTSILISQFIFFFFIPFVLPALLGKQDFWNDPLSKYGFSDDISSNDAYVHKENYIYVYNGFRNLSGFIYIFIVVPLSVWFFGKRYCSWFCACGNLAETVGTTSPGRKWVIEYTPRGEKSSKLERLQYVFFSIAFLFGIILFLDIQKLFSSKSLLEFSWAFQFLVVDFMFGSIIGVGAYPFLGTRIWCRYGCPLAGMMRLFGKYFGSKFRVQANDKCRGIGHCTAVCPMGIDVASYAHKDKKP
ncbi:MAG: 4Fe-4S binding protein, partial [Leptospiraceae bacterium]|nr:4Fe-4S binding protein [Leptospiraceae bacterium]